MTEIDERSTILFRRANRGREPFRIVLVFLCLATISFLVACTAGPNALKNTVDENYSVAGFWRGLWQGFISPLTFIISLFSDSVTVYEVHNNGGWYNLGFLFGAATIFGGGGAGSAGAKQSK